jgi:Tol biopolymer transport system component
LACSVFFFPLIGHAAPNQTRLVFNQASSGTHPSPEGGPIPNVDVFTVKPDGTGETQLTSMQSTAYDGELSPDGTKLLFTYYDLAANKPVTAVANTDGTNVQVISDATDASWPPDGNIIAVQSIYDAATNSYSNDIVLMNPDGTNARIITNTDDPNERYPLLSPDGKTIAYSGAGQIQLMNIDGTNKRVVPNSTGVGQFEWSPDGKKFLFATDEGIVVMNTDGSGKTIVAAPVSSNQYFSHPVWSPDGKKIAYTLHDYSNGELHQIYTIESDGTEKTLVKSQTSFLDLSDWGIIH